MIRRLLPLLCLSYLLAAAEPARDAEFEALLRKAPDEQKVELLRELPARGLAPFAYLGELYAQGGGRGFREVLLGWCPLAFARAEGWFDKVPVAALARRERLALWKRAAAEPAWCAAFDLAAAGRAAFAAADGEERRLIVAMAGAAKSPALLEVVRQAADWTRDPLLLGYALDHGGAPERALLAPRDDDGELLAAQKIRGLRALDGAGADLAAFDRSPSPAVRRAALAGRDEARLRAALDDASAWVRAGAVEGLLAGGWRPEVAERVLARGEWLELGSLLEGLLANREKVGPEWAAAAWTAASAEGRVALAEFLARAPDSRWWPLLTEVLEKEEGNRPLVLRVMRHQKPEGRSDWLFSWVEKKVFGPAETALALEVLYFWREQMDGARYLAFFQGNKYEKGGPGGGFLLRLIGIAQAPGGAALIAKYLNQSEKNPYPGEAVEAAGWQADPSLEKPILAMHRCTFAELKDPMAVWAVRRCRGERPPLPVPQPAPLPVPRLSWQKI